MARRQIVETEEKRPTLPAPAPKECEYGPRESYPFLLHICGPGGPPLCGASSLGGANKVVWNVIVLFDHPAACLACIQERAKQRKAGITTSFSGVMIRR